MKRTIILPTMLLIIPVWALYVTYRAPETSPVPVVNSVRQPTAQIDSAHEAIVEDAKIATAITPSGPFLPSRAAVLSKRHDTEDGLFHLCEEKGTLVYKIRLKKSGDELTVCAQTGKLLAVGDRWVPQETFKKS